MATTDAIAAITRSILALIEDGYPRTFGALAVSAIQLTDIGRDPAPPDGFTLCLYRVGVNSTIRNTPPRPLPDGRAGRPPVALDLHYLLTPWAGDVDTQQRLLGWALRHLADQSVLPASLLNRGTRDSEIFRPDEAVELVFEPLSLAELTSVWPAREPHVPSSLSYEVRNVVVQ